MTEKLSLNIVRGIFLLFSCLLGAIIALGFELRLFNGLMAGACFGALMIVLDYVLKSFTFREFSHGTIGLMIGLFCAWLILRIEFFELPWPLAPGLVN